MPEGPPHLGICWVILTLVLGFCLYHLLLGDRNVLRDPLNWITWGVILLGVNLGGPLGMLPASLPVFGYGAMVLIGFTTAMWFSMARAGSVGHDPELILDASFWVLGIGILGGRLAYLIQYADRVFAGVQGPGDFLYRAVNLSEGGLVQIGGLVGGTLGFLLFARRRKVNFFEFADIMTPAIFIGIGFGRIGCLLNGCCYGDRCELPWGISFPYGSPPFIELVLRGFIAPDAAATFPLHPTQIYSSINGFVLALVTAVYFWYRQRPGDVFAVGCILYAITRIQIEFLRADEMGQLGTSFTISQFYSLGIILIGVAILYYTRQKSTRPQTVPSERDTGSLSSITSTTGDHLSPQSK